MRYCVVIFILIASCSQERSTQTEKLSQAQPASERALNTRAEDTASPSHKVGGLSGFGASLPLGPEPSGQKPKETLNSTRLEKKNGKEAKETTEARDLEQDHKLKTDRGLFFYSSIAYSVISLGALLQAVISSLPSKPKNNNDLNYETDGVDKIPNYGKTPSTPAVTPPPGVTVVLEEDEDGDFLEVYSGGSSKGRVKVLFSDSDSEEAEHEEFDKYMKTIKPQLNEISDILSSPSQMKEKTAVSIEQGKIKFTFTLADEEKVSFIYDDLAGEDSSQKFFNASEDNRQKDGVVSDGVLRKEILSQLHGAVSRIIKDNGEDPSELRESIAGAIFLSANEN